MSGKIGAEYFDPDLPLVGEIKARHGNMLDLTAYKSLSDGDVADAILTEGGRGIIIPDMPKTEGAYRLWDRSATVKSGGRVLPLRTALQFKRYGPEADLTRYGTTQTEIREAELTPRKAFRDALGDNDMRESLLYGAFRGVGWWDPTTHMHRIISFDVFPEAALFRQIHGDGIDFNYILADGHFDVPSCSGEVPYKVTFKVFPVTDNFLIEWLMTQANCGCRDQFQRSARGRQTDDTELVFKYRRPEQVWCKHTLAGLHAAEGLSRRKPGVPAFRLSYPRETEDMVEAFISLKTRTLLKTEEGLRRPRKVDIGVVMGKITGYTGPDVMWDLAE
jgi:hypothetical protein